MKGPSERSTAAGAHQRWGRRGLEPQSRRAPAPRPHTQEAFAAFFKAFLTLKQRRQERDGKPLLLHERTSYLAFTVNIFQVRAQAQRSQLCLWGLNDFLKTAGPLTVSNSWARGPP